MITASLMAESFSVFSSYATNSFSLARLTEACPIPGSLLRVFSILPAHAAQVMPLMLNT